MEIKRNAKSFVVLDFNFDGDIDEEIEGLDELYSEYKEYNQKIEEAKAKKKELEEKLTEKPSNGIIRTNVLEGISKELENARLFFRMYKVVDALIKEHPKEYQGVNTLTLLRDIEYSCPELEEYTSAITDLDDYTRWRRTLVEDRVSFRTLDESGDSDRHCYQFGHSLIRTSEGLKCIACGASTKRYNLTEEQLDFLTICAEAQHNLRKDITERDLPLINVLKEFMGYSKGPIGYNSLEEAEELYLNDEAELSDLTIGAARAHLLDAKKLSDKDYRVRNPKYLANEEAHELLLGINKELERIKNTDSKYKDLMIETCMVAKYEVLILAGKHIPTLYEKANEDEKYALAKAYAKLLNSWTRRYNEFFSGEKDALWYDCYTANPDINNKVLEMLVKRPK